MTDTTPDLIAQTGQSGGNTTANETANETANATANGTAADAANGTAGGGGMDGGGGFGLDVPSPWEMTQEIIAGIVESFTSGVASLVDLFNRSLLTLPASGDPAAPQTWLLDAVNDPFWSGVAVVYLMCTGLAMPIIWGAGWFNVAFPRGRSREERLWTLCKATLLIAGGWFLLMGWFHLWNEAILTFAPSGDEFLATPGDATRLGLGIIVGAIVLLVKAVIVLAGILIHAAFIVLSYLLVATWPLAVALHYSGIMGIQPLGTSSMVAVGLLSPLYFFKALLLRLLFELPLDPSNPEAITTILLIMMGVLIAFVGIPWFGLQNLLPHTVVGAGMDHARNGKESMSDLRERAPSRTELRERVTETAGSGGGSRMSRADGGTSSSLQSRSRSRSSSGSSPSYETIDVSQSQRGPGRQSDTRTRTRRSSRSRRDSGN